MTNAARVFLANIWIASITCTLSAQTGQVDSGHEQTPFTENDERFQQSFCVPPDVVKLLLRTKEVKSALQFVNDRARENGANLFRGVTVHLSASDEDDLLVVGNAPITGADNGWFWLVRSIHGHSQIVLFAGANSLELLGSRTHGLRDVRSRWSSPAETRTSVYRFDGERFALSKEQWTENRH